MRYCKVVDGKIEKYNQSRKDFGVGENSSEEVCTAKGYYPIYDNVPTYDANTHRIAGSSYLVDEATKTVTKSYDVAEIPLEELQAKEAKLVETTIQKILDDSSISRGYDNIVSECSYATSTGAFGTEAQKTVNWRDAVWTYVFTVQADVMAGTMPKPTLEELVAGLPIRGA